MANQENIILVNPNNALNQNGLPNDFKTAQNEDLTIYVELTASKKSRSIINSDPVNGGNLDNNAGESGKINFISGSAFGPNRSLTTSYTDISSASLKLNDEDLEGFGIDSIDISFDTAYTPLIKIKFIDTRGGMFQRGNDSKYSVFFELPYPIFNLKVKGYYGRTVSYCLHLVKWNSLFNSNTGNFEIDAEFIGYTFAILADLLIGFLRAAPYVVGIGDTQFNAVKEAYEAKLAPDNLAGNQVITIDEMFNIISKFETQLPEINQKSTAYQQLINVKKSVDVINKLREINNSFIIKLQSGNNSIKVDGSDYMYFLKEDKRGDYDNYVNDMSVAITELNEYINNINTVQTDSIKSAIISKKINISDFIQTGTLITNAPETLNNQFISTSLKYDLTDSSEVSRVNRVLTQIKSISDNPNLAKDANGGFYFYDFYKYTKSINEIIRANSNTQNDLIQKYQEELRLKLKSKDFNFNPSLENVFRIIMASAETFLRSVNQVAIDARKSEDRQATLEKIITQTDTVIENNKPKTIYPFPLYREVKINDNGRRQLEEAWLGSNNVIDPFVIPEIDYTEKLLRSLITLKQADLNREIDLTNSTSWFAINPLDTPLYKTSLNPYYDLSLQNPTHPDEYLRLMMYRTFTYLGLGNPYSLDGKVMEYMAKFEANNLFYGFPKSDYNQGHTTNKRLIRENYSDADKIIGHWLNGSSNITNYSGTKEAKKYMSVSGSYYAYRYIDRYNSQLSASTSYIPVSGGYTGQEFYNGSTLKTPSEMSNVTEIDFLGNYINCDDSVGQKIDDNAKYLDIIPYSQYNNSNFNTPKDRAADIIDDENAGYNTDFANAELKQNTIGSTDETKGLDPLKYKYYVNEFFKVKPEGAPLNAITDDSDGLSDLSAAFITNPDKNSGTRLAISNDRKIESDNQNVTLYDRLINDTGGGTNIIVPNISFVSINTAIGSNSTLSLFGSPLYYAQNAIQDENDRNYAKSYLFLNTLPFTGLYGKDDLFKEESLIKGLFTKNAGFIKIPTLWAAWIGSLLWRYEYGQDEDVLVTKAWYNSQPVSLVKTNDRDNKTQYTMPSVDELFYNKGDVATDTKASMFFKFSQIDYKEIDKTILGLPQQAKDAFIIFFEDWSDNSFKLIKEQYEIFNDNFLTLVTTPSGGVEMEPWVAKFQQLYFYDQNQVGNVNGEFSTSKFEQAAIATPITSINTTALDNLDGFSTEAITIPSYGFQYSAATFFLPYLNINLDPNPENGGNTLMRTIFSDLSVIVNYTPRTFLYQDNATKTRDDIKIPDTRLKNYLGFLTDEYNKLYDDEQKEGNTTDVAKLIFNTNNTDFIKLNIYRHLKAINDKWIYSDNPNSLLSPCAENDNTTLIDRFLFIDKNWENIGDEFIINPFDLAEKLRSKYNQSLYDVISNVLARNNFNFIPLPNYVEYTEPKEMELNIFKPYPYIESVKTNSPIGPKFICMYIGQPSTHLNLKGSFYPDDSFNLEEGIPDLTKKNKPIPAFEVNYGTQNQNFFKDLKLDQREFTETQESLEIIDNISQSGDKNKVSFASQNLFNVYQTRSYSAEVTALGMPLIQPMMYFQLNNVPMFRGAYVIISTSHSIKPNHMTTTFKGVRVKKENTPINKQVIEMKDFDINESDTGQKYDLRDTQDGGGGGGGGTGPRPTTPNNDIAATGNFYIDGFNGRISTINDDPRVIEFNRQSNTKKNGRFMTYNEIFEEIGRNTGFDASVLKIIAVMESGTGINKGVGDGINKSGFVGLMQFGRDATIDAAQKTSKSIGINNYLQNKINISEYEFFAQLDGNKIKYPASLPGQRQWSIDPKVNDRTVNSMFDDYISTLAAVFYAQRYVSNLSNPIDIYITHQQGLGGIQQITEFPDRNISDNTGQVPVNMRENLPTGAKSVRQNQEWYAGWAGNVEAAASRIDPNYTSKFNSKLYTEAQSGGAA